MKRFSLTALLLAVAFFVSSTAPAIAGSNGSIPDFHHLAAGILLTATVLISSLLRHHLH